jgi:serine/threonine-protein kinase RsbW
MIAVLQRERNSPKWQLWTREWHVSKREEAPPTPRSCRVGTVGGLDQRLDNAGPTASLSFAVQVCLEEAVANIIMYSTTTDDRLEIVVEVERRNQTLVARIEDNGSAFDPTQVPRPPVPASLAEAKVGNLGIHLVRSFASGMHYERRDNRNRLTIWFIEESANARAK